MVEEKPPSRIAVTGVEPGVLPSHIIDTNAAFLELLQSSNNEVIIMGYRFTEHSKDEFIDNIKQALEEGKRVHLLTDHVSKQPDHLKAFFANMLNSYRRRFNLWSYEDNEDTIMHIKSIVIDSDRMYLGSANFSRRGITENIEMGVIMYEKDAIRTVKALFKWLTEKDERVIKVTKRMLIAKCSISLPRTSK